MHYSFKKPIPIFNIEPPSPRNVVVFKINSTALNVTWDKQTLVELKGLADYIVVYSPVVPKKKRQSSKMVTVPWTESHVIITNLTVGAQYDITVSVSTSVGMSGKYSLTSNHVGNEYFHFLHKKKCRFLAVDVTWAWLITGSYHVELLLYISRLVFFHANFAKL